MKRFHKSEGFTLIELLIVIIIIGILAAIAIPMFLNQRDKAKVSSLKEARHTVVVGVSSYATDHGDSYPSDAADLRGVLVPAEIDAAGWPQNAWTGGDITTNPAASEGDLLYDENASTGFTITMYGKNGAVVAP
jgi:prepilin-type N-terminal cleavage/methylation domain-containing protein